MESPPRRSLRRHLVWPGRVALAGMAALLLLELLVADRSSWKLSPQPGALVLIGVGLMLGGAMRRSGNDR